jgi:nucleoside-diphosphate-sugar epimerase
MLDAEEPYALRTTELTVIDTGLEVGIKTHVVMAQTVYGTGSGPWNKMSVQVPVLIRSLLKQGYVALAGDDSGEWGRVHIADLVDLLNFLLTHLLEDKNTTPSGKDGIIFASATHNTWLELAQEIIDVGVELGKIPADTQIKHVGFEEAAATWGLEGMPGQTELGFTSNSRAKAERAREWGWELKHVEMTEGIKEDWFAITAGNTGNWKW